MNRRNFITNSVLFTGMLSVPAFVYGTLSNRQNKLLSDLNKSFPLIKVSNLSSSFLEKIAKKNIEISQGICFTSSLKLFPIIKENEAFLLVNTTKNSYRKISFKQVYAYEDFIRSIAIEIDEKDEQKVVSKIKLFTPHKMRSLKKGQSNDWVFMNAYGNKITVTSQFGEDSRVLIA